MLVCGQMNWLYQIMQSHYIIDMLTIRIEQIVVFEQAVNMHGSEACDMAMTV